MARHPKIRTNDRRVFRTSMRFLALASMLVGSAGCGGEGDSPAIHPVTGQVLVDGRPAAQARISFHRSGDASPHPAPYAETDALGGFSPSTRLTGDGAPAGDYALTIVWPEIKLDHGEEIAGPDRLRGLYANPGTSGLKVSIKEGKNVLPPFELNSSSRATNPAGRGR